MANKVSQTGNLVVGNKITPLDGLRAIAVILVIYFHSSLILSKPEGSELATYYYNLTMVGWCGVDLFFVISGFLITGILIDTAYTKNCLKLFYIRRALRIFPLYYLVLLSSFCAFALLYNEFKFDFGEIIYILYLQNWQLAFDIPRNYYFDHFWSLAVEEQFYIFWPLIFLSAYKRGLAFHFCIAVWFCSFLIRVYLCNLGHYEMAYAFTISRVDELAAGGFLATLIRANENRADLRQYFKYTLFFSAIIILAITIINGSFYGQDSVILKYVIVLLGVFFAALIGWIVVCEDKNHKILRILSMPILLGIGRISYGLYVYHWLVMCILVQFDFFDTANYWISHVVMFVIGGILSYILAWLSYSYYEQKVLKLKDHWAAYSP